jgi:hypothetical protein
MISSGNLIIIGTNALLRPTSQDESVLFIQGTANVQLHRLEIDSPTPATVVEIGITCSGSTTSFPTLLIRESIIHPLVVASHCSISISNSIVGFSVLAIDDGAIELDRVHLRATHGISGNIGSTDKRYNVRITNSVLENIQIISNPNLPLGDNSDMYLGFNTIVGTTQLRCRLSNLLRVAVFENNLFVSTSPGMPPILNVPGSNCAFFNNLTFPQEPGLGGTNINVDPKLVDIANGNFRLQPGSPAIDKAAAVAGPNLDHDFTGGPRPIGVKGDIGAFEIH